MRQQKGGTAEVTNCLNDLVDAIGVVHARRSRSAANTGGDNALGAGGVRGLIGGRAWNEMAPGEIRAKLIAGLCVAESNQRQRCMVTNPGTADPAISRAGCAPGLGSLDDLHRPALQKPTEAACS